MDAFGAFKTRFQKLVAMLARRGQQPEEAEDLVQEAYVRLLTYEKRDEVREPEAFLARAALNLSIDRGRRARAHLYDERPIEDLVGLPDVAPSPEDEAANDECLRRIASILDEEVGSRARLIFFLHCEGRTHNEIARQVHMSRRGVEASIARSIRVLAVHALQQP